MSITESERITALEQRQADLERRIAQLERDAAKQTPWPWNPNDIDPYRWPTTQPGWPVPETSDNARCHVCQNRWKDMTHYVCNHNQCPSRITWGGPSMAEDQLPRYSSDCGSVGVSEHHFTSIAQMEAWQRGCKNPTDWTTVPRGSWPAEYRDGTRGYPPAEIPLS